MGSAGFSALCAQGAVAVVANRGNFGLAARDLARKDSVKALLMAMGSAGLVQGVGIAAGLPITPADVAGKGAVAHLQRQAVVQGVGAVVGMATGERPEDALRGAAVGAVAGVAGGVGAGALGDAYKTGVLDVVTHKLAHAGLGAIGGAIISGERGVAAGAMGAFVAETFADVFSPEKPMERVKAIEAAKGRKLTAQEFTAYYQQELEAYGKDVSRVQDWAKVTAATTALLAGRDVTTAVATATVAVENNFAILAYYGVVAAGLAYSAYEVHNAYETGGVEGALKQLGIEIVTDVAGAAALRVGSKVAYKIGSAVYPTVEAAVTAALDKMPGLRLALGRLVDKLVAVGEKVSQSAVGQSVAKVEQNIVQLESKVLEKLRVRGGVEQDFFKDARYTDKVARQMQQGDYHAFPDSFTGFQEAGKVNEIIGGDGVQRFMLRIPGEYRGKKGVFELIKEPDGTINHRLFRPE
jgi:hypothetical protein